MRKAYNRVAEGLGMFLAALPFAATTWVFCWWAFGPVAGIVSMILWPWPLLLWFR